MLLPDGGVFIGISKVDNIMTFSPSLSPSLLLTHQTHDTDQGSYSRVLTNSDRVEDIQLRWGQEPGYFTLTRKPNMINIDPLFSSSRETANVVKT